MTEVGALFRDAWVRAGAEREPKSSSGPPAHRWRQGSVPACARL